MSGVDLDSDKFKEYFDIRNKTNNSAENKRIRKNAA